VCLLYIIHRLGLVEIRHAKYVLDRVPLQFRAFFSHRIRVDFGHFLTWSFWSYLKFLDLKSIVPN
jgi:hypothetical protein